MDERIIHNPHLEVIPDHAGPHYIRKMTHGLITIYANSFTIIRLASKLYYQYDVVFILEFKNVNRHIQSLQHLQNVFPLSGSTGKTFSLPPTCGVGTSGTTGEGITLNVFDDSCALACLSLVCLVHSHLIPELKNAVGHTQPLQYLQNIVTPDVFNLRVVYDSCTLAYSPGRFLLLAGITGKTFLLLVGWIPAEPQAKRSPSMCSIYKWFAIAVCLRTCPWLVVILILFAPDVFDLQRGDYSRMLALVSMPIGTLAGALLDALRHPRLTTLTVWQQFTLSQIWQLEHCGHTYGMVMIHERSQTALVHEGFRAHLYE
ncbi:hypothetical protein BYT27DRAFT_7208219 [Phlegmacium glaucopus]|nr:hypothetical protein BYT27DRAFT_7208219 [Phlegmacium glaucopus]